MKKIFRRRLLLSPAIVVALALTGAAADNPAGSAVSNVTTSLKSGVTNSLASKATSSCPKKIPPPPVASRTTGSLASIVTGTVTGKPTPGPQSSLTSSVSISPTTGIINRPAASPVTLSPYAEELAKTIKFNRQVLIIAKEETHERIQRLVGYDDEGYQIVAPGIAVSVPEDKSDIVLFELRRKLHPLKYMAFVVEMNAGMKADKIGIIRSTDQYEILRIMHTDGDEYEISNQDVIDRLKEWEKLAPFEIIGADSDWVEMEFKKLPPDLKAFAEEVYEFSPDAVDGGPGTVEGLIKEIQKTKRLLLLWD